MFKTIISDGDSDGASLGLALCAGLWVRWAGFGRHWHEVALCVTAVCGSHWGGWGPQFILGGPPQDYYPNLFSVFKTPSYVLLWNSVMEPLLHVQTQCIQYNRICTFITWQLLILLLFVFFLFFGPHYTITKSQWGEYWTFIDCRSTSSQLEALRDWFRVSNYFSLFIFFLDHTTQLQRDEVTIEY